MGSVIQDLLRHLQAEGVSVWLDGITRAQLQSGELASLVRKLGVSGVTTNPTLLGAALAVESAYASSLGDLEAKHVAPSEAARLLAAEDVRAACDVLSPTFERTEGIEGWVSLDLDPGYADDFDGTMAEVRSLSWLVDRPNLMIKIPATTAGVTAVAAATAEGYHTNATLVFSLERYADVLRAYSEGLQRAKSRGLDITAVHSVVSMDSWDSVVRLLTRRLGTGTNLTP